MLRIHSYAFAGSLAMALASDTHRWPDGVAVCERFQAAVGLMACRVWRLHATKTRARLHHQLVPSLHDGTPFGAAGRADAPPAHVQSRN